MQARTETRDEPFEVETWRGETLSEAFIDMGHGKRVELCLKLARSASDLHQMERAIRNGCPPDLMRAIFT
jgi:hypothetical protein